MNNILEIIANKIVNKAATLDYENVKETISRLSKGEKKVCNLKIFSNIDNSNNKIEEDMTIFENFLLDSKVPERIVNYVCKNIPIKKEFHFCESVKGTLSCSIVNVYSKKEGSDIIYLACFAHAFLDFGFGYHFMTIDEVAEYNKDLEKVVDAIATIKLHNSEKMLEIHKNKLISEIEF